MVSVSYYNLHYTFQIFTEEQPLIPAMDSNESTPNSRMSDVTLWKKKNADVQAAFRARRANYIAILKEMVTNLESVDLELQSFCQENRNEVQELRDENSHLWHEFQEQEKFWSAVGQGGITSQGPESNNPSTVAAHQQHTGIGIDLYGVIGY